MARRTPKDTTKPPAERRDGATYFYAAEVVRILGLDGIDYAQLRRLLRLARSADAQPSRRWARYSFEDLVALRVAVRLAGGTAALSQGRRLQIAELELTCARLQELGIERPLLEVRLRREGRAILAEIDGVTFRPATGQLALTDTSLRVREFLGDVLQFDRGLMAEVRRDIDDDRSRLGAESDKRRVVKRHTGRLVR